MKSLFSVASLCVTRIVPATGGGGKGDSTCDCEFSALPSCPDALRQRVLGMGGRLRRLDRPEQEGAIQPGEVLRHSTMEMVQRYVRLAQVDIEEAQRQASPVYNWDLRV